VVILSQSYTEQLVIIIITIISRRRKLLLLVVVVVMMMMMMNEYDSHRVQYFCRLSLMFYLFLWFCVSAFSM